MADALLSVRNLTTVFDLPGGPLTAVNDISFEIRKGETLGLVGESGSGKSVTAFSLMRLVQPPGRITAGRVLFQGRDLLDLTEREMCAVRGAGIGLVFQEPMAALNPVMRVGKQIGESLVVHGLASTREARDRAIELLRAVKIVDPEQRVDDYPHQLSGGMRQRVMIAMALAAEPQLLIADEPTTALDVSIQAQILELLAELRRELGMAMILVTHDLGVVADLCDRVAVMYAGQIVEQAPIHELFAAPAHPYTAALLASVPTLTGGATRLTAIPGTVPPLHAMPSGCRFHTRCRHADSQCSASPLALKVIGNDREVRCRKAAELELEGIA